MDQQKLLLGSKTISIVREEEEEVVVVIVAVVAAAAAAAIVHGTRYILVWSPSLVEGRIL